ncbi:hypothetical protein B0H13DRAFT_1937721 [Mycena leptocephala]|nr:hypothetical protein B0H13DRAFT_1937721 [Mycena leptocephala]
MCSWAQLLSSTDIVSALPPQHLPKVSQDSLRNSSADNWGHTCRSLDSSRISAQTYRIGLELWLLLNSWTSNISPDCPRRHFCVRKHHPCCSLRTTPRIMGMLFDLSSLLPGRPVSSRLFMSDVVCRWHSEFLRECVPSIWSTCNAGPEFESFNILSLQACSVTVCLQALLGYPTPRFTCMDFTHCPPAHAPCTRPPSQASLRGG